MPARRMRPVAAALGYLALAAGCAHPVRTVPPPPAAWLSLCGTSPQPAPGVLVVICNTSDLTARNLAWTGWGDPTATAAGTAVVDLCAYEDCHTGAFTAVPVKLTVSQVKACPGGKRAYTVLRYAFPRGSPWPRLPAGFSTEHYIAAPGRPLPPADQAVKLTCGV